MRWPSSGLGFLAGLILVSGVGYSAEATPIGPGPVPCATCQGSVYDLTYSGSPTSTTATTETFRITYTIDTTGYNGAGSFIDAVALKVASSFVDATLVSAPNGVAAWTEMSGGLNNAGCSGSGSGFDCVMVTANVNLPLVPNGTYTWEFDVEVPTGTLFNGLDEASVKGRYITLESGVRRKAGALVSENITLSVPEPGLAILVALVAFVGMAKSRTR